MQPERILVACDGSRHADRALEFASDLARSHAASLHILCVREAGGARGGLAGMAGVEHTASASTHARSPNLSRVPGWMVDAMDASARSGESIHIADALATQVLQRAQLHARRRGATEVILEERAGRPAREILHYIGEVDIDTVVLGSRGLGELASMVFGSVSHEVARKVPAGCTCITVSTGAN